MPDYDFLGRMILRSSRSVRSTSRASWTRLKSRLSYAAERRVDRLMDMVLAIAALAVPSAARRRHDVCARSTSSTWPLPGSF